MVSATREAIIRLIQEKPESVAQTFTALGIQVPETRSITIVSPDATEVLPVERRIDVVLKFETYQQGEFLLLVEVQRGKEAAKPSTWLYYQAYMQQRHKLPATLVVVCPERRVARWAADTHLFGAAFGQTAMLKPLVLSPVNVPKVTTADDAERDLALASLSAIVHSADMDHEVIMRALSSAMRTRTPDTDMSIWTELVERGLGRSPAAEQWRKLMAVDLSFFQSETSQQLRREGREQGREEGLVQGALEKAAQYIINIARSRGVEVSESDRERILSCKDEELLDVWFERASTATSVDELWGAGEVPAQAVAARSGSRLPRGEGS